MILLQFIIAIYNYADTQNTLSSSVTFIFAFYSSELLPRYSAYEERIDPPRAEFPWNLHPIAVA